MGDNAYAEANHSKATAGGTYLGQEIYGW